MKRMTKTRVRTAAACLGLAAGVLLAGPATAQTKGAGNELVVGTIQDLSGPLAAYGKSVRDGMNLRVAEANEQGGVNGRRLKLLIEDSGYDPRRAVLAAQRLVKQEKAFVMLGVLGTAPANAAFPVLEQSNVINLFPMALAREMYEPLHKLKFAVFSSYVEQMSRAVPSLYREKKATRACTLHQDDEFGLEVMRGAEQGLKSIDVALAERTTYKRGATDFSSQVARLKQAGCDFVVLGTVIRETVGAIAEARKVDFHPTFVASVAAYTDLIPKLGGKGMDGLYVTMASLFPYEDDASQALRFWAGKYKTAYGEAPNVFSTYGYMLMDRLVTALQKAGANPTTESLVKALESLSVPSDLFGTPAMRWSANNHLGSTATRLSQLQGGRWKLVLDYDQMR